MVESKGAEPGDGRDGRRFGTRETLYATPRPDEVGVTESEQLFEEFCEGAGWEWERVSVAHAGEGRRPDYSIRLQSGDPLFIEVKQFDPNPEEKAALSKTMRVFQTVPGDRIRKAVQSGAPQLKALSQGQWPALLVVFDNVGTRMHTDPYAVLTAMRGLDVVPVTVPADPAESPVFHPSRPGPKKKLTAKANTTLSGIGVLKAGQFGPSLEVYHNPHAAVPLEVTALPTYHVSHFAMSADQQRWESMR